MLQRTNDRKTRSARKAKITALVERPGTPGEQVAATAALERIAGAAVADPKAPRVIHLTPANIRDLPAPAAAHVIYWDDQVAGLGVRVTAAGVKAYVFNYRVKDSGRQRRVTIGQFPNWKPGAARTEAERLRREVDGGGDPRGDFEEKKAAATMAELCDRFETEHLPRKRASTADSYERALRLHIRPHFGAFAKVADVEPDDIEKLHQKVTAAGHPSEANRVVSVCSKMFSLAIKWKMRTAAAGNPCKGAVERNPENKRTRYMTPDELVRIMATLATHSSDQQFANIVRLLITTGARSKSEVMAMRWADIDLAKGTWTKPGATTKQKTVHHAKLSASALAVLAEIHTHNQEFVFPSDSEVGHVTTIKKGWRGLCKTTGIVGLRIHDLRHSFASFLVSGGASLELIGALLGHTNPATTARYAHLLDEPLFAAVEKVGAIVDAAAASSKDAGAANTREN